MDTNIAYLKEVLEEKGGFKIHNLSLPIIENNKGDIVNNSIYFYKAYLEEECNEDGSAKILDIRLCESEDRDITVIKYKYIGSSDNFRFIEVPKNKISIE